MRVIEKQNTTNILNAVRVRVMSNSIGSNNNSMHIVIYNDCGEKYTVFLHNDNQPIKVTSKNF